MNRDVCEHFNPIDLPCDKCKSANVQKSTLRGAAQQALEALEGKRFTACGWRADCDKAITALRAALAEPEGGGNLPPPLQEPKDFDHAIGADRFKVVRGAFWWHVLIGDSPTEHGKFRSRASAEKMAADLLREFRNGAFVQHEAALAEPPVDDPHRDHWVAIAEAAQKIAASTECGLAEAKALCAALDRLTDAALAEPVQEPVAYIHRQGNHFEVSERHLDEDEKARGWTEEPLYTAPPQRPAEPVQEPVAWSFEARHIDSAWAAAVTLKHPGPEGKYMRKVTPLYTAPPQRKPLTEEEIDSIWDSEKAFADIYAIARAIERAIWEKNNG